LKHNFKGRVFELPPKIGRKSNRWEVYPMKTFTLSAWLRCLSLLLILVSSGLLTPQTASANFLSDQTTSIRLKALSDQGFSPVRAECAAEQKVYQYAPNPIAWVDPLGLAGSNLLALPAPTGSNPWMPNAPMTSSPAPAGGLTVQMAMAPDQTRPGGWATTDNIPDANYVRNGLAVTPDFKSNVSHVQTFQVPEGVQLQHGTVGPKKCSCKIYAGGGSQVQILNYADRAKLIPVGPPREIK
jgi:hypothetical protein